MKVKIVSELNNKNSVFIYIPKFLDEKEQKYFINYLNSIKYFEKNKNFNGNKIIRLQRWYHKEEKYFCPKWEYRYKRWESYRYDQILEKLQKKIQKKINNLGLSKYKITIPNINSCLINKYRNGEDYIRAHIDTKEAFGESPTIIGLSLGSKRELVFKRILENKKKDKLNEDKNFSNVLESGSLYIMGGESQKYYTHEIPKSKSNEVRYSLTFRETL